MNKRVLVCVSGKRKSGKDYLANQLKKETKDKGWDTVIVGLSHSLKEEYARLNGLRYNDLLSAGDYKEMYRREMIEWGEEKRRIQPDYFVRKALESAGDAQIVIVSDCRRMSDLHCLQGKRILVRVEASLSTRSSRGFAFTRGIDDEESECGLDEWKEWDVMVKNDGEGQVGLGIQRIITLLKELIDAK